VAKTTKPVKSSVNLKTFFKNISPVEVSFEGEKFQINLSRKLIKKEGHKDLSPYFLINQYLGYKSEEFNAQYFKELSTFTEQALRSANAPLNQTDVTSIFNVLDMFKLEEIADWIENVLKLEVLPHFEETIVISLSKNAIQTYTRKDYINFLALVMIFSAMNPMYGLLTYLYEGIEGIYVIVDIFKLIENHPLFKSPVYKRMDAHADLLFKDLSVQASEKQTDFETIKQTTKLTTLFGRLATHNVFTDDTRMDLIRRFIFSIEGKTGSQFKLRKEDANSDVEANPFESVKRYYSVLGYVEEELKFITRDGKRFAQQYFQLTPEQHKLYDIGFEAAKHSDIGPEVLGIMALVLKKYIHPKALEIIGLERAGEKSDGIWGVQATAFMLIWPISEFLAKVCVSSMIVTEDIILGDSLNVNISKSELAPIFPLMNEMGGISLIQKGLKEMLLYCNKTIYTTIDKENGGFLTTPAPDVLKEEFMALLQFQDPEFNLANHLAQFGIKE